MKRTLLIALSGIGYFIISLILFTPFRMKPIENYNLVALPLFLIVFLYLFYKACTVEQDSKGYLFGYFAGILMWQCIGEIPSLRVPSGAVLQFSDMNIKVLGGYFYVLAGWTLLYLTWKIKMLKDRAAFVFMIFLGIWSFEVYMDNYSSRVPLAMMGVIANIIMVVFLLISIWILYLAKKSTSIERRTVLGGILYLTLNIVLMSSSQWKQPQSFYIKYGAAEIESQIQEMQKELDHINQIKKQMIFTQ
jgi:hypothetical protein